MSDHKFFNKSKNKQDRELWTTQSAEKKLEIFASMIDKSILSYPDLMKRSFVSGIFTGLGATVGVALISLIIAAILNWLGAISFLKGYVSEIQKGLPSSYNSQKK